MYVPEPTADPAINDGNSVELEFNTIEPLFVSALEIFSEPDEVIVIVSPELIVKSVKLKSLEIVELDTTIFSNEKLLSLPKLFPNIFITGSSSSILGIISGFGLCFIYFVIKKVLKVKLTKGLLITFLSFSVLILATFFSKVLPNKFDSESIQNYEFSIPLKIIDSHRQFIWGFSIEKFKQLLKFQLEN